MKAYAAINDENCGWIALSGAKSSHHRLKSHKTADWLIIGSGYTGLSAAHRLAEICPNEKVILIDAENIGEGASARNSGFIVDSTLNDGQASHAVEDAYKVKYDLNLAGMVRLKKQIQKFKISCDWDESGKYHCAVSKKQFNKLLAFDAFLDRLGIPHQLLEAPALHDRLGIHHYQLGVQTDGGILINPAALSLGLAAALDKFAENVEMYANSPVLDIAQFKGEHKVRCAQGQVHAKHVIIAVNALMPRLGYKAKHVFPLTLSGGLTRQLSDKEHALMGRPAPWGVLSAHPMGATVRLTNDKRILLRNTVTMKKSMTLSKSEIARHRAGCLRSIVKRFPMLPTISLEHYWQGNVCISQNSKPVFERSPEGLYLAACYNAGGIAMGSLFGKLIVDYALGNDSNELRQILNTEQASRLPPKLLSSIGIVSSLAWRRWQGKVEA